VLVLWFIRIRFYLQNPKRKSLAIGNAEFANLLVGLIAGGLTMGTFYYQRKMGF